MCGIFGLVSKRRGGVGAADVIRTLYRESESRGKEASGLILGNSLGGVVLKDAVPASVLVARKHFLSLLKEFLLRDKDEPAFAIGHSRLVTDGTSENHQNNQPVLCPNVVGVHNGIVTNANEVWAEWPDLIRETELDTEVLLRMLGALRENHTLGRAVEIVYQMIEGVANIAVAFEDQRQILLATNNGSLYFVLDDAKENLLFASERFILRQAIQKTSNKGLFNISEIERVEPNTFMVIDEQSLELTRVPFGEEVIGDNRLREKRSFRDESLFRGSGLTAPKRAAIKVDQLEIAYEEARERIKALKRCSRCILPETMPFISFDANGVCSYCQNYVVHSVKGKQSLSEVLNKEKGGFDCLVTLSGGRDSCYGLHYVTRELGLNPITYTYDWGMVTDLARRNQMRLCGKLGIEHILVSADIGRKRLNIRRNVAAWLKRPELGMIPLFMAGDKQYFYWANRIASQNQLTNIVLCENLLETTKFKSGFCGIAPNHGTSNTYTLSVISKLQMLFYYGTHFLKNPAYVNTSLFDTLSAFSSYYVMKHNFVNLFDYIEWDEETIARTLVDTYNWEVSGDTKSTWRIGDGTAAFYNFIYYMLAGFTENDTFRSNQIREGSISREQALELADNQNAPRFESIEWYLKTINLPFTDSLSAIVNAERLYR